MSEVAQLCVVCARGIAGGPTRWSWLACGECRRFNDILESRLGRRPLPLGRHSIMNSVSHRIADADDASTHAFALAVEGLSLGFDQLMRWQVHEVERLASSAELPDEIMLTEWRREFPSGRPASAEAFMRLLGTSSSAPDVVTESTPSE